ncbi:MAG: type II toxin-antitoxin system HicB family antitoxin [bacterium]|nr:type II toxin-antitoxin system HicB family antitoxin [bacterium]
MGNFLEYRGYSGCVEFSAEDRTFHGKINFINDLVTFEGATVEDLENQFKDAVDDYLATCKKLNINPQKSFKGTFNLNIPPELHKRATFAAAKRDISLNRLVELAIEHELSGSE